jgi:hypothetical protein
MPDCSFLHSFNRQPLRITRTRVGVTRLYTTATTSVLQEYLRLPTGGSTTELVRTFAASIAFTEEMAATTLDTSTLSLKIDLECIPIDTHSERWVELPLGPVTGVTNVVDADATHTTGLTLDTHSTPHKVQLPDAVLSDGYATISYTAGVDDWDDVTQVQQTAVLFAFAHHWQNREAVAATQLYDIPYTLRQALVLADYSVPI